MSKDDKAISDILAVLEDEYWDPITKLEIIYDIISNSSLPDRHQ